MPITLFVAPFRSWLLDSSVLRSLRPVYSDATQLNSTSSWVELSCVTIDTLTDATQLSPTIGNATNPVEQRTVTTFRTDRWHCCSRCERVDNSTSSWDELSCVAINRPLGCRRRRAMASTDETQIWRQSASGLSLSNLAFSVTAAWSVTLGGWCEPVCTYYSTHCTKYIHQLSRQKFKVCKHLFDSYTTI